jgi:CheY-like chemotaxis protein
VRLQRVGDFGVLRLSLQVLGAHGHPFTDGDAALEYLTKRDRWRDIDLVLADLTIPSHMGGFELARALTERGSTLPVAGISGYWQGHDSQVKDRGLLGVLGKPFDVDELQEFVTKMLALFDDTDRTDTP